MRRVIGVLAIVAAGLAACGRASASSPEDFADGTCEAFVAFAEDVSAVTNGEQGRGVLSGEFDPRNVSALEKVLGKLRSSIATLADDIDDLPPPDVKGGEEFQADLVKALRRAESASGRAADKADSINAASPSDLIEFASAMEDFGRAFGEIGLDLQEGAPEELARAFENADKCREAEKRFGNR